MTPPDSECHGPYGDAYHVPIPDDVTDPRTPGNLTQWLITAPQAHPLWTQYLLAVVKLIELDGVEPPRFKFDGATHELLVIAINPETGTYDRERLQQMMRVGAVVPFLMPVNIAEQFEATDAEMVELAALCAIGVTVGALWPETAGSADAVREQWLGSARRTLAHIRGEPHVS